ncbi:MAG: hypothetical protein AAF709_10810 [Pseudomonadota bacterium]
MTCLTKQVLSALCLQGGVMMFALASRPDALAHTPSQSIPAVDGVNGKLSFGGVGGDVDGFGASASGTVPLGDRFGFQLDGAAATINSDLHDDVPIYAAGAHLFWRGPNKGLIGLYGDITHVDIGNGFDFFTVAVEGALYLGRFSIDGIAGIKGGDTLETDFHNQLHFSYYPTDSLSLRLGHSYSYGYHGFSLGGEWALGGKGGVTPSFFAVGLSDLDDHRAVVAGMKFYFGQRDKPLIRIHREADPRSYVSENDEDNRAIIVIGPTDPLTSP